MIEADKRKAIFLLHNQGMSLREMAGRLGLSRNTVRRIIEQEGVLPKTVRSDKQRLDEELLRRLHQECDGRIQRLHEKLVEEEKVQVTYSTLTRMLRELGISTAQKSRCDHVPDEPGLEMQHDTTIYWVKLSEQSVRLAASLIYLRYSKRRYLRFYRSFDRFKMKCFFHQALMFWGCSARQCIIDNTNLARWRGSGKNAVIVPEMEAFSKQYASAFAPSEAPCFKTSLQLPVPAAQNLGRIKGYLASARGLPAVLTDPLLAANRIYADGQANTVFLLLGAKSHPVGAELRGTTQRPWRGLAPGSNKDLGFFEIGPPSASSLVLCESAIDAISCCALHPEYRCLSTAGARPNPRWLSNLIRPGLEIYCGYDADPTGDAMALAMAAHHPEVKRLRPPQKDWNMALRSSAH